MTYQAELAKKKFQGNFVVQIYGEYFAVRSPDSGLSIPSPQSGVLKNLRINPVSVDLRRVNTTVGQYSFQLVDKDQTLTALLANNDTLTGAAVRIWVGRNTLDIDGVAFPFADYFELPRTKVKKVEHNDNTYVFTVAEETDTMTRPAFNTQTKLGTLASDVATILQASGSVAAFTSSGYLKVDNEFISYTSLDLINNRFNGCVRGEYSTTPAEHKRGVDVFQVYRAQDNPIDLFLKMLISGGGGGTYDTYPDGLGINPSLIDITALENLRDSLFVGEQMRLYLYNIDNALRYIENEILFPNNLRIAISSDSKITLALLDQSVFGEDVPVIDEDTISDYPKWVVDDNTIVNQIIFDWDYDEGEGVFNERTTFEDADSISRFGLRQALKIQTKGIIASLSGAAMIADRANRLLLRFGNPNPQVTVKTHIDKSLVNIGDKVFVSSSQIPASSGTLAFNGELEVLSRSIDQMSGEVTFLLAFTSYSGVRGAYISPSDIMVTVVNQKTFTVASGRGAQYKPGWVMRLWLDGSPGVYESDPVNTIESIVGDTITMTNNFTTTLSAGNHRIRFANYDEVIADQQRYAFLAPNPSELFDDGSGAYVVLF